MLLRSDKKVVTYGKATDIDTTTWENMIQISAYKDHAIGLREDRTAFVTGKDAAEYDVSEWSGIRQVVAFKDCVVGVTMDGEIVFAGPNRSCMLDCQNWKSVQRIIGAACIVVAERNDGSLIAADECEVTEPYMTSLEHRIVSGTAVDNRMLFVLDNGRVKATGNSSVLENIVATWTDMQQVAVGNEFAIGLRKNGTVVSIGVPANEELDVSGWKDVAAICVGGTHVFGLCQDGTVLTGGSESGGLADIANENYWI
jgi:alpha-tubulin suppressor-like RCC1 family protein